MSFANQLPARKFLGQNFLVDPRVQSRIVEACELTPDEEVFEIGPGLGHLTQKLITRVKKVYAIEKDHRFIAPLKQQFPSDKFQIFDADILDFDFRPFPNHIKIIGNLPFNLSTPIIENVINHSPEPRTCFFTVQKEFAQRLHAKPHSKEYGSLSCFVQYHSEIKILFTIAASCFKPAPKVTSAFIKIQIRPSPYPAQDPQALFKLIQRAFQQRRKQLANALQGIVKDEDLLDSLKQCRIDPQARAENLTLKNYVDLSNVLTGNFKSRL